MHSFREALLIVDVKRRGTNVPSYEPVPDVGVLYRKTAECGGLDVLRKEEM
jgi:hypothetical protein